MQRESSPLVLFTPTEEAGKFSSAAHFQNPSTPLTVRFSNSTGIPLIPDGDANADPRGIGIRFNLPNDAAGRRVHTDIIAHSVSTFPTRTGAEFLEFLRAIAASPPGTPSPTPVEQFVGSHPSALAHVQAPKPPPKSWAGETYFSVNAFKLVDSAGKATFIRYRVVPTIPFAEEIDAANQTPNYLQDELHARLAEGAITFKLVAQVAEEGDATDDATIHWPDSRAIVELGTLKLDALLPDGDKAAKTIIYDPIPRIPGVEPSDDPLLEMRAAIYIISGKERRAA